MDENWQEHTTKRCPKQGAVIWLPTIFRQTAKKDVNYSNSRNSAEREPVEGRKERRERRKRKKENCTLKLINWREEGFHLEKQTSGSQYKRNVQYDPRWDFSQCARNSFLTASIPKKRNKEVNLLTMRSAFGQVHAPHRMERKSQTKRLAGWKLISS